MPASSSPWKPAYLRHSTILLLLAGVTMLHNGINLSAYPFLMILTQKFYFVPVLLAAFWFGLKGGLSIALVAILLYPHHGLMGSLHIHGENSIMFKAGQMSDQVLLMLIGLLTGWLRDMLRTEMQRRLRASAERDVALEEVRRSRELLGRSEQLAALGEMAAGIAHEVRNPLTGMQGAVDILRRSGADETRQKSMLDRLQHNIAHLDNLTRHFLEFARPPKAEMQRLDVQEVVKGALELLRPQARQSRHEIRLEQDSDGRIHGDRGQIRQLLVNLLLNALQFADAGSAVRVRSAMADGHWQLTVENEGPPIPDDLREKIFTPFFTTHANGTGLGLPIAARIAESHHGTIDCASADGLTRFTLSIPEYRP